MEGTAYMLIGYIGFIQLYDFHPLHLLALKYCNLELIS